MLRLLDKVREDGERKALDKLIAKFKEDTGRKAAITYPEVDEDLNTYMIFKDEDAITYMESVKSYIEGERIMWGIIDKNLQQADLKNIVDILRIQEKKEGAETLKIICDEYFDVFNEWLRKEGKFKNSTFTMGMGKDDYRVCDNINEDIIIKEAVVGDIEDMVPIGMEAFDTTEEEERKYNLQNFEDNEKINYIGYIDNRAVGMVSINIKEEESSVADLAVLKSERRKGIGKSLLSKSLKAAMDKGLYDFVLSVESDNDNAIKLYEQSGFKVTSRKDCIVINL